MISPVLCSSLRSTGQELPSAFIKVTSNLVPMILNFDAAVSIGPNRGTTDLYRLGGLSDVERLRTSSCGANSTFAFSLLIFFRKKEAITVVGVW
jgi:hypothetical protein